MDKLLVAAIAVLRRVVKALVTVLLIKLILVVDSTDTAAEVASSTAAEDLTDNICTRSMPSQQCPMTQLELEHDALDTTATVTTVDDNSNATESTYDCAIHDSTSDTQQHTGATKLHAGVDTARFGDTHIYYQQVCTALVAELSQPLSYCHCFMLKRQSVMHSPTILSDVAGF
jgi:hypothetical protein